MRNGIIPKFENKKRKIWYETEIMTTKVLTSNQKVILYNIYNTINTVSMSIVEINIKKLSETLGISYNTIRKDMKELEAKGLISYEYNPKTFLTKISALAFNDITNIKTEKEEIKGVLNMIEEQIDNVQVIVKDTKINHAEIDMNNISDNIDLLILNANVLCNINTNDILMSINKLNSISKLELLQTFIDNSKKINQCDGIVEDTKTYNLKVLNTLLKKYKCNEINPVIKNDDVEFKTIKINKKIEEVDNKNKFEASEMNKFGFKYDYEYLVNKIEKEFKIDKNQIEYTVRMNPKQNTIKGLKIALCKLRLGETKQINKVLQYSINNALTSNIDTIEIDKEITDAFRRDKDLIAKEILTNDGDINFHALQLRRAEVTLAKKYYEKYGSNIIEDIENGNVVDRRVLGWDNYTQFITTELNRNIEKDLNNLGKSYYYKYFNVA